MPRLTRWYVRAALMYLLLGFSLGALLLANKGLPLHPALWAWLPAHIEFLLMGWVVQMALGIAFWIAPRFWKPPRRGNITGVYLGFGLLNSGIWLVVAGTALALSGWVLVLGRLFELLAAAAVASSLWPRIVSREG
jgi:hypothetical protein